MNVEEELVAGMRERVAGIHTTRDVVRDATRRHRRRSALWRTGYSSGALGLAAALFALTAGHGPTTPPDEVPDPPRIALAAAVASSENLSCKLRILITSTDPPGQEPVRVVGAFDPATDTGYLVYPDRAPGDAELRLVDGVLYVGRADGRFHQLSGRYETLIWYGPAAKSLTSMRSTDADSLFQVLRDVGTVTRVSAGRYHFTATNGPMAQAGDVTLDGEGRISRVTYEWRFADEARGRPVQRVDMTMYEYGTHVTVERPVDVVPFG